MKGLNVGPAVDRALATEVGHALSTTARRLLRPNAGDRLLARRDAFGGNRVDARVRPDRYITASCMALICRYGGPTPACLSDEYQLECYCSCHNKPDTRECGWMGCGHPLCDRVCTGQKP